MYTRQEFFDLVVNYARTMTKVCREEGDDPDFYKGCLYRSKEGTNACFIGGAIIPDDKYRPEFENRSLYYVLWEIGIDLSSDNGTRQMLLELQGVHDTSFFVEQDKWEQKFRKIADKFGVEYR